MSNKTKDKKLRTKKFLINSPEEMKILGKEIAESQLVRKHKKAAIVFGLQGNLGSGKTTFLQGFAQGLGLKERILSPTFVIMKRFRFNNSATKQFNDFFHIDCYRIKKPEEILDIGFKKVISNPRNIVCVEWADRIKKIMPPNTIWLRFSFLGKEKRKVISFLSDF
ncbi:tRNA (adenosine(37)-N6)-threonylcarbamoyltransferase complex ATPase subunit type 1 TsaE [bacterium]|nr:tRNA (adenosine(37)-N6)-threonylcarbamoyltransferase complex ATPase subunit type 1 TsaE [bacterium]